MPSWVQVSFKAAAEEYGIRSRHRAAVDHLARIAVELSHDCLSTIDTLEDWQQQRSLSRPRLQFMLGLDPLPERLPIAASCHGILERPAYRIEKWVLQSVPGLYVTANFYLPRERPKPLPCVVYLNGHWPSADGAKTGYQDRYLWYPANGFALLVIDPLGFGEIPGIHPGMNRLNWWHWLSLGYTPAGVEVWNAMRALDWLEIRPEIDASRMGVTGISGGGVMTQYLAALDDRVAVAAPSCSTYTIGTQVALGLVSKQCDCTFYPNVFGMDFPEVLALIAPRPLLILGGRKDPIFPPEGFRAAFQRARGIYSLYGHSDPADSRIRLAESNAGHTDPPHFLRETHAWMCRWLRDVEGSAPSEFCTELLPELPEHLRCTEGMPIAALNGHIHELWIRSPSFCSPASREAWTQRKAQLLDQLRSRLFAWFPASTIPFRTRRQFTSGGYAGEFAEFGEYEFDSEQGVPVNVCLLTPKARNPSLPLIIWVKSPSDHVTSPDIDEFLPLLRSHAVAILTPRFADGPLSGRNFARIERTAALVGCSIATLRVWDLIRTVAWMRHDRGLELSDITVYGTGEMGIVCLYAALFDLSICHVILRNPPCSHLDGPAIPTILRDTDITEVAGILAPRKLSVLSNQKHQFSITKSIYALNEADSAMCFTCSIVESVLGRTGLR